MELKNVIKKILHKNVEMQFVQIIQHHNLMMIVIHF